MEEEEEESGGGGGLVDAYINVPYLAVRCPLKSHDTVCLVRLEPDKFEFIHVVHGRVHSLRNKVLSQLIDQGHLILHDTVFVETLSNGDMYNSDFSHYWVKIGIRRVSVELVTSKIYHTCDFRIFFQIQFGGADSEDEVFRNVLSKWKTSKQFLIESSKASSGLSPPSHVLKLELFEHQKQGLRWMLDREEYPDDDDDDDELPPFWEESNGVYRTLHSCFFTLKKPQRIRGGILADDSGMGKTCTLLSLIAYTKHYSSYTNKSNIGSSSVTYDDAISALPYLIGCGGNLSTKDDDDDDAATHVRKKHKVDPNLPVDDVNFEWKPTLVVCPPYVLATWKRQIEQCTWPGSLKLCTYSGKNKPKDPNLLRQHDIVLTTYNVVRREESDSLLYQIEWWRIILEDAHVLKETSPITAFVNLKAKRRWAVTGKPVHKDLKNFNLVPIMECLQLEQNCYRVHPLLEAEVLMGIFSLQRTMPRKFIENHLVILSKNEQHFYDSMEAEAKATGYSFNPRSVRAAVLHLWLCCNSLYLYRLSCAEIVSSKNVQDLNRKPKLLKKWVTVLQEEKDNACPVCMDEPEDMIITRCTHMFCRSCIMRIFEKCKGKKSNCPLCRGLLTKSDIYSTQRGPSVEEKIKSLMEEESLSANRSSKISALLNLLLKLRNVEPNRKPIVLSQFRRMLVLVAEVLSAAGFNVMCMDVIGNAKGKAKTVEEFQKANPPVVLLTTFKSLSNTPGLDLSDASPNIYMMEPCWNDLIEEEALSRIHRLWKREDGNVVRLVCKNSIEERVLEIRKQKQQYGSLNSKKEVNVLDFNDNIRLLGL